MDRQLLVSILSKLAQEHHHGDTFTLDPKHPIEMSDEAWKRHLESQKRQASTSHWDDPMMDMIEDHVRRAKKARPDLPSSSFPEVGKDITANHPSYPGYDPKSEANVLARTERGSKGWGRVTDILHAQENKPFLEFEFPRHEFDPSAAGKVLLGAAGILGARLAAKPAVRYAGRKLRELGRAIREGFPKMIPKTADMSMLYPAMIATSMGVNAIKVLKDNKARQILQTALVREQALKRKAIGTAAAVGAAGAGAGYLAGKKSQEKKAVDPLAIGGGALATALTTALTLKQIKSQQALSEAVGKAQLTRRLLLAALATSTAGGVGAGYALGKKQPRVTEKTTIMQPLMITQEQAEKLSHDKVAIGIYEWLQLLKKQVKPNPAQWQDKAEDIMRAVLTWDSRLPGDKEASTAAHSRALRKLVEPVASQIPGVSAIEKRHGSDIVTSTLLSDDASTPGK